MRWDEVILLWLDLAVTDSDVTDVLGSSPALYMAGERDWQLGSMEYSLISNTETELWEIQIVQVDFWVEYMEELVKLAAALRRLWHHDLPITVGGIPLWSEMIGADALRGASKGVLGQSLDFQLKYLRGNRT